MISNADERARGRRHQPQRHSAPTPVRAGLLLVALGVLAMTACTNSGYVPGVQIDPTTYVLSEFECAPRLMNTNVDGTTVQQDVWWGTAEITNTLDTQSPHYSVLYRVEFENGEVKEGFAEAVFALAAGESAPISTSIGLVDSTPISCELQVQDSPFNY